MEIGHTEELFSISPKSLFNVQSIFKTKNINRNTGIIEKENHSSYMTQYA